MSIKVSLVGVRVPSLVPTLVHKGFIFIFLCGIYLLVGSTFLFTDGPLLVPDGAVIPLQRYNISKHFPSKLTFLTRKKCTTISSDAL